MRSSRRAFVAIPTRACDSYFETAEFSTGQAQRHRRSPLVLGRAELSRIGRREAWTPFEIPTQSSDEPAAIIFTSGSTGPPKGVLYEHGMFAAQVDLLQEFYGRRTG